MLIFSRQGTLSQWHPNYEFRPGQLEMAEAVAAALADRRHLIVEAGTGTGKTLAYLRNWAPQLGVQDLLERLLGE
ncbi:MAG: hypothetical protein AAB225_10270 [Acidobacteriota bacterium]